MSFLELLSNEAYQMKFADDVEKVFWWKHTDAFTLIKNESSMKVFRMKTKNIINFSFHF